MSVSRIDAPLSGSLAVRQYKASTSSQPHPSSNPTASAAQHATSVPGDSLRGFLCAWVFFGFGAGFGFGGFL